MAAALAPMLLRSAAMGAAPIIGQAAGGVAGRGISKLGKLLGFKKGGARNPKAIGKALARATVRKTGVRRVKKNQLVIPAGLAKKIKAVARRRGRPVKRRGRK